MRTIIVSETVFIDGVLRKPGESFTTNVELLPSCAKEVKLTKAQKAAQTRAANAAKKKAEDDAKDISDVTNDSSHNFLGEDKPEDKTEGESGEIKVL